MWCFYHHVIILHILHAAYTCTVLYCADVTLKSSATLHMCADEGWKSVFVCTKRRHRQHRQRRQHAGPTHRCRVRILKYERRSDNCVWCTVVSLHLARRTVPLQHHETGIQWVNEKPELHVHFVFDYVDLSDFGSYVHEDKDGFMCCSSVFEDVTPTAMYLELCRHSHWCIWSLGWDELLRRKSF